MGWGDDNDDNSSGWGSNDASKSRDTDNSRSRGREGNNSWSNNRDNKSSWGSSSHNNDDGDNSGWGSNDASKSRDNDSGRPRGRGGNNSWGNNRDNKSSWGSSSHNNDDGGNSGWGSNDSPKSRDNDSGRPRGRGGNNSWSNNRDNKSSWGSSSHNNDDSGNSGWGNNDASKSRDNDNGRPRGRGGNNSWGNNRDNKSSWGSNSHNNDDGGNSGWGSNDSPKSRDTDNGRPRGREGNNSWSNNRDNKSSWGSNQNNDGDDQPTKRFKSDDDSDKQEARPAPYKPEELNLEEEVELQGAGAGENFQRYNEQKVTCLPANQVIPIEKFEDIITSDLLLENIRTQKYTGMTPIQKWAMPAIRDGHDLIGCAQTGSGKTAAFLLPVLQTLLKTDLEPNDPNSDCQNPYCLILSPTRELANQIFTHAMMLSKDSIIKCNVIYGQISTTHLKSKLSNGCHILISTPGRLKDFVNRGWIGFKNIKYVILDEGDRLVDDGFTGDIKSFFDHDTMPAKDNRQTLFFSATFKKETQLNAIEHLKENFIFLSVGRIGAANEDIKQEFLCVSRQDKKRELKKILAGVPESEKTIVFTQTKMAADMLAGFFTALNLSSTSIHGDRHQSQREQAIKAFRKGEKRFLISSPVGNRGLDLPKVSLVINYDLPNNIDEYVHRIGRTGRAGHIGRAISFYDAERDSELVPELIQILSGAKQDIPDWMTSTTNESGEKTSGGDGGDDDGWGESKTNASDQIAQSTDDWGASTMNTIPETNASNEEAW